MTENIHSFPKDLNTPYARRFIAWCSRCYKRADWPTLFAMRWAWEYGLGLIRMSEQMKIPMLDRCSNVLYKMAFNQYLMMNILWVSYSKGMCNSSYAQWITSFNTPETSCMTLCLYSLKCDDAILRWSGCNTSRNICIKYATNFHV